MKASLLGVAAVIAIVGHVGAQTTSDSLRIFYVGKPVGWEHYTLTSGIGTATLKADFAYIDRGRRIHSQIADTLDASFATRSLTLTRFSDDVASIALRIERIGSRALVERSGVRSELAAQGSVFAFAQYTPVSQHLALIRFWRSLGKPDSVSTVVGVGTNGVAIRLIAADTLRPSRRVLHRYTIDGIVWGREYLWLDDRDRIALFASAGGGLSTKAVAADLLGDVPDLMQLAATTALGDLARAMPPLATHSRTIALTDARLIDGTGAAPIDNAIILVRNDSIVAAGSARSIPVPAGAERISLAGKTVIPGLWDMHAHLHQWEWIPAYLAAGVTTVRDMGNELPFLAPLRSRINAGRIAGPRILAAGLIDGGGLNAFGEFSATTPQEGRLAVGRYRALGFEQMKLYSLLSPAVVGAITREAHAAGMTVTGHIPNSLTLVAAVDSGMDQVAHLPLRGDPASDSVKAVVDHLRERGTVIDPTISWNEIGGHASTEPLESFQPVVEHLPAAFIQFRVANWGTNVDTATAHARLARSLASVRALHDAGVPIVAGTDEGVPAFSVYRELELYVKAGFTPMQAIMSATSAPARAMKLNTQAGTVTAGATADLVVLDANPLDNISNVRRVNRVMRAGVFVDTPALWHMAGFQP